MGDFQQFRNELEQDLRNERKLCWGHDMLKQLDFFLSILRKPEDTVKASVVSKG